MSSSCCLKSFPNSSEGFLNYLNKEVVEFAGQGTLVGQNTGNLTLVLGISSRDEGGVVKQSVLRSSGLGLQSSEKSLLGSKNLDGGSRQLSEVVKTSSVGQKSGSDRLTKEDSQVGSHVGHLFLQIGQQVFLVLEVVEDIISEILEIFLIDF